MTIRRVCRAITGASYSTHTRALEVMLGLTPLNIAIQSESPKTFSRIQRDNSCKILNTEHSIIWFKSMEQLPLVHMPTYYMAPTYNFNRAFEARIPDRAEWTDKSLPPQIENTYYTDGSLMKQSAGTGIYCDSNSTNLSISLEEYPSIFLTEVYSIIASCHIIKQNNSHPKETIIFTDSQLAIRALINPKITSAIVLECYENLNTTSQTAKAKLLWVPGHSGIEGNEKADKLAKLGASSTPIGPEPIFGYRDPKSDKRLYQMNILSSSHPTGKLQ